LSLIGYRSQGNALGEIKDITFGTGIKLLTSNRQTELKAGLWEVRTFGHAAELWIGGISQQVDHLQRLQIPDTNIQGFPNGTSLDLPPVPWSTEIITVEDPIVNVEIIYKDGTNQIGKIKESQIQILRNASNVVSVTIVSDETAPVTRLTPEGLEIRATPQNPFVVDAVTREKLFTKGLEEAEIVKIILKGQQGAPREVEEVGQG